MPCVPKMKYAFFGCTLETGSKIIGLFSMVVYALCFLVTFFYYAIPFPEISSELPAHLSNETIEHANATTTMTNSSLTEMTNATNEYEMDNFVPLDIQSTFFLEESTFAQVAFGGLLLYGIKLKNPDIIFSWILLQIALIWHSQLILLLNLILAVHINTAHVIWYMTEELAIVSIEMYCMAVVYNYIELLRNHGMRSTRNF